MLRRRGILAAMLLFVAVFTISFFPVGAESLLTAHFIDVGQGDSCWLRLPNGDNILVDGGKPQAGPTVVAHLRQHGVSDVQLMVATHGDADHIGGLLDVLRAMPVRVAFLDSQDCTTQTCLDLYHSLASHGVLTGTVRVGQSFNRGDVTLLVLNPSEPLYPDRNENSVVLRVSYGSVDFLLTGDAETGAERRMIASGFPLEAEILKVAHHGSNSSSSAAFLGAVGPEEAIISIGPNPYGHPSAEVLQRLTDMGAEVWRTDQMGTIVVMTNGVTYTIGLASEPTTIRLYLPIILREVAALPPTATPTQTSTATSTATPTLTRTPTPTPTPTRTEIPQAQLRISCLSYSGRREYVCISNDGTSAQNMTGWRIQSVVGNQWYTFPSGYVLEAGAIVYVNSGPDAQNNPPTNLLWTRAYIWNDDGDEAKLYDGAGRLVDNWTY